MSTRVEIGKTGEILWSVFTQFPVFPISSSVEITVYQYGKKFYICFII